MKLKSHGYFLDFSDQKKFLAMFHLSFLLLACFHFCLSNHNFFVFFKPTFFMEQKILPNRLFTFYHHQNTLQDADVEGFESYYYFYDDWKDKTISPPIAELDHNRLPRIAHSSFTQIYRERPRFFYLRNSVIEPSTGSHFSIFLENGSLLNVKAQPRYFPQPKTGEENTSYAFRYVVTVPYYWPGQYGHTLIDGMGGFMHIPNWVWALNPVIVAAKGGGFLKDHFDAIGLGHLQILITTKLVFAEYMFICCDGLDWCGFGSWTISALKKKFDEYYGTNKVTPTNYIFINKEPRKGRYFTNYPEVVSLARNVTGLDWKIIKPAYNPRKQWARTMASIRILVIPAGTISMNSIFMRDGTGIVNLWGNALDYPNAVVCHASHIWTIAVMHMHVKHVMGKGPADPERVINNIKRMLYTVEHQKYPPHNLFQFYDVELAKEFISTIGDQFIYTQVPKIMHRKYIQSLKKKS